MGAVIFRGDVGDPLGRRRGTRAGGGADGEYRRRFERPGLGVVMTGVPDVFTFAWFLDVACESPLACGWRTQQDRVSISRDEPNRVDATVRDTSRMPLSSAWGSAAPCGSPRDPLGWRRIATPGLNKL